MSDEANIPQDDPTRSLTVATAEDAMHVSVVGDTYTILVGGDDTAGKYCLIDMLVAPGGGPPPHRHDFEESFTLLDGELEFTFRDQKQTVRAGTTVNVPANAPHAFVNAGDRPARMLCLCVPAGQERMFLEVGDRVPTRTSPPPTLTDAEVKARQDRAAALAPKYKTEFVTM